MQVALGAVATLPLYALFVFLLVREMNKSRRSESRLLQQQQGELLDRLMFLSGRTWVKPPREDPPQEEEPPPDIDWKEF